MHRQVPTCVVFKDGKKVGYAGGVDAGNIHVCGSLAGGSIGLTLTTSQKLMRSHVGGWNNSGLTSVARTDSIIESA